MKKLCGALLLFISLYACNNNKDRKATIIHVYDSAANKNVVPKVLVANDTLIRMNFSESDTGIIASASAYLNGDDPVICEIAISNADSLHASVVPDEEQGNIRFTQIILPNGKMDGPFGRTISYATPQLGTYKLIIGENKMAGDKWKGKFKVKVWVK